MISNLLSGRKKKLLLLAVCVLALFWVGFELGSVLCSEASFGALKLRSGLLVAYLSVFGFWVFLVL